MMTTITYKFIKTPLYIGIPFNLWIGIIDDSGILHPVYKDTVGIKVEIIYPIDDSVIIYDNVDMPSSLTGFYFYTAKAQSIEFKISYMGTYGNPSPEIVSIQTINNITRYTGIDYYNLLKSEQPIGVYSNNFANNQDYSYIDDQSTANVIADADNILHDVGYNVFPELAPDIVDYSIQFFGFNISQSVIGDINKLLQVTANIKTISNLTLYNVETILAEFIYYLTGESIYVSVGVVIGNLYDYWLLGQPPYSTLGQTTYLLDMDNLNKNNIIIYDTTNIITDSQKYIIKNLINKITACYSLVNIIYSNIDPLSIYQDIGLTYPTDIRIVNTLSAIAYKNFEYNNYNFKWFNALSDIIQTYNIVDINITPASGSTINTTTKLVVTATYIVGRV